MHSFFISELNFAIQENDFASLLVYLIPVHGCDFSELKSGDIISVTSIKQFSSLTVSLSVSWLLSLPGGLWAPGEDCSHVRVWTKVAFCWPSGLLAVL